jgi:four helix bundle protein
VGGRGAPPEREREREEIAMPFHAYELGLQAIRELRVVVPVIKKHDADLAKQIRRAASSVTLNINEGSKRRGEDRLYLYSVAAGSANEVLAGLDTAEAWGWIGAVPDVRETYDHMLGILWKVIHKSVDQAPQEAQQAGQHAA